MDIQAAADRAKQALARRTNALKATLEEIELLEPLEAAAPGTYTPALTQLHTKRNRQADLIRTTEALIKGYTSLAKKR